MKTFAEKVRDARTSLGLGQSELAALVGISTNSIFLYEKGKKFPRPSTMSRLAKALKVSVTFLSDDNCDDPMKGIESDDYITKAREVYGSRGAKQARDLTNRLTDLFAGGEITQDEMDGIMKAVQDAYWIAKEKNKRKKDPD